MVTRGVVSGLRTLSSLSTVEGPSSSGRAARALEMYMRGVKEHDKMMGRERENFERGKRHLANMMGMNAATMSQTDIDSAIAYLFPSGLSDKKALPIVASPDQVLPRLHSLSFDREGKPEGARFYTLKPAFYQLLSDVAIRSEKVERYGGERERNGMNRKEMSLFPTGGSVWLNEEKMAKKLGEKISTHMYTQLMMALEHLVSLPGSITQSDFIMQWRETIAAGSGNKLFGPPIPSVVIDAATNRRTVTAKADVKATYAQVTVSDAGKGEFIVDGMPLYTFQSLQARETLLCPLIVTDLLGSLSITATTTGEGGETAVPRAVRHGLSLSIAALYPEKKEALTLSGLLTRDPRKRERSKVNQPGARSKWIW
ncbi:hypothetical protein PENTCL1PPCAC_11509, partial [Pristionchus entomophagus]